MKLTMLGTGNARVKKYYNTCFILEDENGKSFLVDGGGGNGLLAQLDEAGYSWKDMKEIFISHKHIDHLLGIVWLVRIILQASAKGKYEGQATLYGNEEVINIIKEFIKLLLPEKQRAQVGKTLKLVTVHDGEEKVINGKKVTFFDTMSEKASQMGFTMELENGKKVSFCGDVSYVPHEEPFVKNSDWLLHDAFCLEKDAAKYNPIEKGHSTVRYAAELAEGLNVKNLLLFHTEEETIGHRKELYTEEAKKYFSGNVFVPEDLEVLEI